ncbi:YHS domain-containing protein [Candidatus Protochlamydia phocaeensis]|uniref:YHS domain-containing protein n=1 Tax=Candidatus Protochlamydia phocaeensis TaxID=1414722 RepID=UPI0009ADA961|nr:YHS domain-containing protein [Candidatus Protochlamydia phocaeensis]
MANQSKDPVCGMQVDPNQTQYKTDYQGKHYAFCCQQCLAKFKQNPTQYSHK